MVDENKRPSPRVTELLRQKIAEGGYRPGERLPTIEQLKAQFDGLADVPVNAREVYAPLIAEGLVRARVGRAGGHFLIATTAMTSHEYLDYLDDSAADVAKLLHHVKRIAQHNVHIVDIRKVGSANLIGECFQSSRSAAEEFATSILCELGEPKSLVELAVERATHEPTFTRPGGYSIRIYDRRLARQFDSGPEFVGAKS